MLGRNKVVVKVRISGSSGACVYLDHFIFKLPYEEPILAAKATCVWLNKNHHPVRILSEFKSKFVQFSFAMRSLTQHNGAKEILLLETLEKKVRRAQRYLSASNRKSNFLTIDPTT